MAARTAIDWSGYPEPWRSIGPAFARECREIIAGHVVGRPGQVLPPRRTLEEFRLSIGLSKAKLADLIGVSAWAITLIETGRSGLSPRMRARILERWPDAGL